MANGGGLGLRLGAEMARGPGDLAGFRPAPSRSPRGDGGHAPLRGRQPDPGSKVGSTLWGRLWEGGTNTRIHNARENDKDWSNACGEVKISHSWQTLDFKISNISKMISTFEKLDLGEITCFVLD